MQSHDQNWSLPLNFDKCDFDMWYEQRKGTKGEIHTRSKLGQGLPYMYRLQNITRKGGGGERERTENKVNEEISVSCFSSIISRI